MMTAHAKRQAATGLGVVALLTLSLSLRAPIVAVAPVLEAIRSDLGLSAFWAGLLTSIPILCFGLLTPFFSKLIVKLGLNSAGLICALGLTLGCLLRPLVGVSGMFLGTVILGAAMTIGNVLAPLVIGKNFPTKVALLTGLYTMSMNIGSTIVSATTAQIADALHWRWALSIGIVAALGAAVLWWWAYPPKKPINSEPAQQPSSGKILPLLPVTPVWRMSFVWLVTVAFAFHNLGYYGITAWLPTYLIDVQGMTSAQAGTASSVFQLLGIGGPLLVPLLKRRLSDHTQFAIMGTGWLLMPIGLLVLPNLWLMWSVIGGTTQAAVFTLIIMVVIERAKSADLNRRMMTFIQTVGFCIAALGPVVMGVLRDSLGGWAPSLLMLSVLLAITLGCLLAATKKVRIAPELQGLETP